MICDHEGQAHSVALKAGQALLYESARLLHSRPHPLQGDYYANFFIHFRPKHWEGYLKVRRPYLTPAARQLEHRVRSQQAPTRGLRLCVCVVWQEEEVDARLSRAKRAWSAREVEAVARERTRELQRLKEGGV